MKDPIVNRTTLTLAGASQETLQAWDDAEPKLGHAANVSRLADRWLRTGYAKEAQWLLLEFLPVGALDAWMVASIASIKGTVPKTHADQARVVLEALRKGESLGPMFWLSWQKTVDSEQEVRAYTEAQSYALTAFKLAGQTMPLRNEPNETRARTLARSIVTVAWCARHYSTKDASAETTVREITRLALRNFRATHQSA